MGREHDSFFFFLTHIVTHNSSSFLQHMRSDSLLNPTENAI